LPAPPGASVVIEDLILGGSFLVYTNEANLLHYSGSMLPWSSGQSMQSDSNKVPIPSMKAVTEQVAAISLEFGVVVLDPVLLGTKRVGKSISTYNRGDFQRGLPMSSIVFWKRMYHLLLANLSSTGRAVLGARRVLGTIVCITYSRRSRRLG